MGPASAFPLSESARLHPGSVDEARAGLELIAESLAAAGDRFVDALYARFFADCPEAAPLFGAHAVSEREEMVSETFRAIVAWVDGESWLDANLEALGQSHVEYGVEPAMYPPFVDAFVATAEICSGHGADTAGMRLLRSALEAVTMKMGSTSAGEEESA